jgi:hypothetical protein
MPGYLKTIDFWGSEYQEKKKEIQDLTCTYSLMPTLVFMVWLSFNILIFQGPKPHHPWMCRVATTACDMFPARFPHSYIQCWWCARFIQSANRNFNNLKKEHSWIPAAFFWTFCKTRVVTKFRETKFRKNLQKFAKIFYFSEIFTKFRFCPICNFPGTNCICFINCKCILNYKIIYKWKRLLMQSPVQSLLAIL